MQGDKSLPADRDKIKKRKKIKMKKIRLFSAKAKKGIEGEEAELYVNFYLVLNKNYIFTFLIDAPNLSCSDRHPIKLWKFFLISFEEEYVKYLRRYEKCICEERELGKCPFYAS